MDFSKFKETERQYRELKEKLNNGEINSEYMKKELKKMMVLDENGNYWMIGGKTGNWYIYNGTEWQESNPFQENSRSSDLYIEPVKEATLDKTMGKVGTVPFQVTRTSEEEDNLEKDAVDVEDSKNKKKYEYEYEDEEPFSLGVTSGPLTRKTVTPTSNDDSLAMDSPDDEQDPTDQFTICKICKAKISIYSIYCPVCGANRKETAAAVPSRKTNRIVVKEDELLLASVKISSLIFFMGGLGLIVGVFCGAAFGIFKNLIPEFQPLLPDMLSETRGGMAGGLIFAAVGGIAAFTISAFTAAILGIVYNIISFIFGGIRFKIK